jgi:hypothetical protein
MTTEVAAEAAASRFVLPTIADVEQAFVDAAIGRLRAWVTTARPGLCARVDDLPAALMARVAERLDAEVASATSGEAPRANVRLLVEDPPSARWQCQWTEAVRLRNPDERGQRRPPLLLLVPPGAALLGSLDPDTFSVISCETVVQEAVAERLRRLPAALSPVIGLVRGRSITDFQRARYLLALEANGYSAKAAGLALCLLGLWPHEDWLDTGDQRDYYLTLNQQSVTLLRAGRTSLLSRVYDLRLTNEAQTRRLYELLASEASIEAAAERSAVDAAWRELDFGRLEFAAKPETVVIALDGLELPKREDGYQVLRLNEQPALPISWTTSPSPAHVPDLTHFQVELVPSSAGLDEDGQGGAETAYQSGAITPGKSARKSFRLRDLRAQVEAGQVPEGLYRARVTAWARATNITGQPPEGEAGAGSNLSDYFWIELDPLAPVEDTPPARQERLVANFMVARREVQWDLLDRNRDPGSIPEASRSWDGPPDSRAAQSACALQFGRQSFRVRLSNLLRRVEGRILSKPEELGVLAAKLTPGQASRDVPLGARTDALRLSPDDPFIVARAVLFARLRGEDGLGLVETADLLSLRGEIFEYAREYVRLLREAERDVATDPLLWPGRVDLAAIDTVRLTMPDLSEQSSVAILLAPTHPLRLLWSLQLALLGEAWLAEARQRGVPDALPREVRGALQGGLQPVNLPPVLFDRRRVGYLQAGQIAPGWDVYVPADVPDKQLALARLSRALAGAPQPLSGGIRAADVADRARRYLRQHPYVLELKINVFNPGDGQLVVDLLGQLDADFPDLRYDVRLFCGEEVRDDLGTALDQLVNPEVPVGEAAAEKYSQGGTYPLHPNLTYSKARVVDFLAEPGRFASHLSVLLDQFSPRIDVAEPFPDPVPLSLFGLVCDESVRASGGKGQYAWERQVVPGPVQELAPEAGEAALLVETLAATQEFVAALGASPAERKGRLPTVRLDLTPEGQNLLYEIHRVSDWVLTLDRHLGLDYYDSVAEPALPAAPMTPETPAALASPAILLDFSPEYPASASAVLMLTAQAGTEVEHLVAPALQRLDLDLSGLPGSGRRVVEWLRSLSGRLAIRLLAAPAASQGVLGMALARAFLGRMGVLEDSLVIPVDAHVELLRAGAPADAALHRTDLILARHLPSSRGLEFTLVEVKTSAGLLSPAGFAELREQIEVQIERTRAALAALFDPSQQNPDALDRPLRNLVLGRWLRFYVGRASRYGLLSPDAARDLRVLLADLAGGYTVSFRTLGLVFELGRDGDFEDASGDVIVHRVGRRSCERLLRGDDPSTPVPPSWDRVHSQLRGTGAWTRPGTEVPGLAGSATPRGVPSGTSSGTERLEPPAGEAIHPPRPTTPHATRAEAAASPPTDRTETDPAPPGAAGAVARGQPSGSASGTGEGAAGASQPDVVRSLDDSVTSAVGPAVDGGAAAGGPTPPAPTPAPPSCNYLVGDTHLTPQWGVLGKLGSESVGLDLNGCNTLSIFGVQGGGKSYTMGSILEMAVRPIPGLNVLPRPLAGVVFHYNESQDYAPEFVSMARPNRASAEVTRLREEYGAEPQALPDILVVTPEDKVDARRREFPGIAVEPIAFHPAELTVQDWRFLMGAVGNDSLYIRELNLVMRSLRDSVTLEGLRLGIEESQLSEAQRKLARLRLRFAEQFVRGGDRLRDKLYPGRLVIVDLRDELIETDEALGLFVVMLRVFAGATHEGQAFSKLIAFDEAHKYIRNTDLADSVVEVIRQMRHQATSVLIASQDPPSLPLKVMELSSLVMLHRMDSPGWLKHIQRAITALGDLTAPALARLRPGEAFLWARAATDPNFTHRAIRIQCRPRATQHGGATKTATEGTHGYIP